jgi:uncharacterized protein (TIRG00374 family)
MEKRVYLLIAVSVLIIIGLVGLADLSELQSILSSADIGMVFLSILSYTLAIVVFALIWHFLLKATELKLSMTNNLKLVFSAVFFNVVTPTASYGGEAVRAYLLSKKFKLSAGKGVATIVAHRIIGTISKIIGFVTFSSFFGFLIVLYFGLRIEWSKGVMEKLFRIVSRFKKVKADSKKSAFESLESYHDGLKVLLKSRGTLLLALLMGLLAWFFVNLVAIFAFMGVGGSVDMENFLLIFTFFSVSRLIPTGLPEFVGSKEAILAAMYSASGLPVSTSVAVIILIRLATQLWMVLLGGAITLELGFKGFNADG